MIYPEFINNKPIGVVAPSCGITDELDKVRFENAAKKLKEKGVETIFGPNVFKSDIKGASASASERAREFNDMVSDPVIGAIVAIIVTKELFGGIGHNFAKYDINLSLGNF